MVALATLSRLFSRLPLATIDGRLRVRALSLPDDGLGAARGLPMALRLRVHPGDRGFPAGIGGEVHARAFADRPGFDVAVVFGCAAPDHRGRSAYADPRSPWYGVFFGYYEVVVDARAWGRPFGFVPDGLGGWVVEPRELARLGKADWNHFSAGLYGVPLEACVACDDTRDDAAPIVHGEVDVGARRFVHVELPRVRVVGPYGGPGGDGYRDRVPWVGAVWRRAFGRFDEEVVGAQAFAPIAMRGRFDVACAPGVGLGGAPIFRTWVGGGSQNLAHPARRETERLLERQLACVRAALAELPSMRGAVARGEAGVAVR